MTQYKGEGRGEQYRSFEGKSQYVGTSTESVTDAIRAAVHFSDVEDGTKLVVERIEVTTEGDPHVSEYIVVLTPAG
jgi:hypothetical protein